MAVDQQIDARAAWIEERVTEFSADPASRDRAIATLLYEILMLGQGVGQITAIVQKEGIGGIAKAMLMGGGKSKNGA